MQNMSNKHFASSHMELRIHGIPMYVPIWPFLFLTISCLYQFWKISVLIKKTHKNNVKIYLTVNSYFLVQIFLEKILPPIKCKYINSELLLEE